MEPMTTTVPTSPATTPVLRVTLDLYSGDCIRNITVYASNVALRDEGLRRLVQVAPILELLEDKLKEPLE